MQSRKRFSARYVVAVASTILTVASLTLLSHAQEAGKPAAPPPNPNVPAPSVQPVPTAAQRYKNIQVLKDLPADQLIPTMRLYASSLGVRCGACHVTGEGQDSFARDDKPMKRTGRQMILMTRNLNQREKVLHNMATCYMCHRGQEVPQTQITSNPGAPGPESAPRSGERRDGAPRENEGTERNEGANRGADKD